MSRVDKGGRSFRPLAKPRPPTSQPASSTAPQSQPDPLGIPSSATSSCQPTSSVNPPSTSTAQSVSTPSSPQPPLFIPEASPPLFIPEPTPQLSTAEVNPPLFLPENDQPIHSPSKCPAGQPAQTSAAVSPNRVQSATKLSAAEKMKLKAKEAKAARAAERLRNPNSSSCASHTSQVGDIPVPASASTTNRDTPPLGTTNQPWSPPIDPLLSIAASVDDTTTLASTDTSGWRDIPVSNNASNYALPASSPSGSNHLVPSTSTSTDHHPIKSAPLPKSKSKRPVKKIIPDPSHSDESDREDISPRLKRKKRLDELRKKKKKKQSQTPDEDTEQLDTLNAKCAARYKKRKLAKNKMKQKQAQKKQKATGEGKENGDTNQLEVDDSETDSDTPIDPTKVAMSELTNPHHRKGQSSQMLEARLKLIVERRAREKSERLATREETKRLARQALKDRSQSVRLRQSQPQENELENQDEVDPPNDIEENAGTQNNNDNNNDNDSQLDISRTVDQQQISEKENRKKLMKEYGLEALNSDDSDMEDLEEVIFDEFANSKNKKTNQSNTNNNNNSSNVKKSNNNNNGDEEEDEEIVEENFEEDDYVPQASQYAPQLRVVDGQIVLDQDSLEVDRRDQSPELDDMEVVEESDSTRLINSHTWSKAARCEKWSADETSLFYDALRLFGSDFEMITQLFPGRTRRQIRAKWNREEKRSPQEITDALMRKKKVVEKELTPIEEEEEGQSEADTLIIPSHLESFDQYAKIVGIDCSGPIPIDPMDKWREKERLEWHSSNLDKAKKSHDDDDGRVVDSDDEDGLVIEENFTGWGEVDD